MDTTVKDAKKVFKEKGTCSQTFIYLLNQHFGHNKENEERASDPLAGGIMGRGHQCGMLWGSSLALGAESFRRYGNGGQAIGSAIIGSQHLIDSFSKRTKTVNCRELTGCDLTSKFGMAKLMLKIILQGGMANSFCFNLAEKWVPEAIQSATEGLSGEKTDWTQMPVSCASEMARKMGASDEEIVMVAGFAGGLGLSGNACGALGAAIWLNSLAWCSENPGKSGYSNLYAKNILKAFDGATDSKIRCSEICGQRFKSIDDHTEFLKNGGCEKLIDVLARPIN
jgi:hypothetical protein